MTGTADRGELPPDLVDVAARWPGWQFSSYWPETATGPGIRYFVARQGDQRLMGYNPDELEFELRAQGQPGGRA